MRLSGGLMKSEDRESMPSIAINTFYTDKYDKIYYDLGEPFPGFTSKRRQFPGLYTYDNPGF